MQHRTAALAFFLSIIVCLLAWNFGSSASTTNRISTSNETSSQTKPEADADDQNNDPDLPSNFHGTIDKEDYLRRRGEYIGLRRGIEVGRPFNPEARAQAIEQMERQEQNRVFESVVNGTNLIAPEGANDSWTPLGPAPLSIGSFNYSGRVTSVVVDPTNSSKIYLGTAQGG